jgi:hypothetical protein
MHRAVFCESVQHGLWFCHHHISCVKMVAFRIYLQTPNASLIITRVSISRFWGLHQIWFRSSVGSIAKSLQSRYTTQNRKRKRALLNTVLNLRDSQTMENFLNSGTTFWFSRSIFPVVLQSLHYFINVYIYIYIYITPRSELILAYLHHWNPFCMIPVTSPLS